MSVSIFWQIIILIILILSSSLFSLAEIAIMSINRYRLRHLVKEKNSAAKLVSRLLERPDRVLGAILIGDTFADILATSLATVLAVNLFGEKGVMLAAVVMTILVLIFGQMIPKTLAALYPQQIALTAGLPLTLFLKLIYPFVWVINMISNGVIKLFGVSMHKRHIEHLSPEELRTLVYEAGGRIPASHKGMLLRILDLGEVTVEDVMIPRNDIVGIDLNGEWQDTLELLHTTRLEYVPVYHDDIDQLQGLLPVRQAIYLMAQNNLTKQTLEAAIEEAYFIPESTSLNVQLLNFRHSHKRSGVVVDEYGDIQGLVTIEDILEEIVGEFANFSEEGPEEELIKSEDNNCYLIDGSINIRELNRKMNWHLSTEGPKTLSGAIIEYLEYLPMPGVCLRLSGYPIEIVEMEDNMVKLARIFPQKKNNEIHEHLTNQ